MQIHTEELPITKESWDTMFKQATGVDVREYAMWIDSAGVTRHDKIEFGEQSNRREPTTCPPSYLHLRITRTG